MQGAWVRSLAEKLRSRTLQLSPCAATREAHVLQQRFNIAKINNNSKKKNLGDLNWKAWISPFRPVWLRLRNFRPKANLTYPASMLGKICISSKWILKISYHSENTAYIWSGIYSLNNNMHVSMWNIHLAYMIKVTDKKGISGCLHKRGQRRKKQVLLNLPKLIVCRI